MTIDIIELAKKARLITSLWLDDHPKEYREAIERFAALYKKALIDSGELVPAEKVMDAVNTEQKAAIKICEEVRSKYKPDFRFALNDCIDEIRARSAS